MKTRFSLLSALFCLMLLWIVSCKKQDPVVTPGGTTGPGSTTGTTTTKSSAKVITAFAFNSLSPAVTGTIDATAKTISATVASGTDVTKLVPTITVSDKATVSPATNVAQDFSKAVTYIVTAEDGSTQAYIATVIVDKPVVGATVCHVVSIKGSDGYMTVYELDAQNRLAKYVTTSSSSTATTIETYDADGYRTQEKTTYSYVTSGKYSYKDIITTDTYSGGRLVKEVIVYTYLDATLPVSTYIYKYEYDAQGNVSKSSYNSGNADRITTIANGVVTGISQTGYTYEVNAQGFVAKETATDGSYTLYKYNAAGQQTGYETYSAKGLKTSYYVYEHGTTKSVTPTNPLGYKGQPTTIPSAYGASGGYPRTKYAYYTVDATGKETLITQYIYTWQVDSRGNLASYTVTSSGAFGSPITTTNTYQYEGCQ